VTLPLTAPSGGVIVEILVKHGTSGANPGTWGFRVLSGTPALYSTLGVPAELPDFAWPANDIAGTRSFVPSLAGVPKGIPIAAGDRLGMVRQAGGVGNEGPLLLGPLQNGINAAAGAHNSGPKTYNLLLNVELMVQYRIEPDADRDGYGDETQDKCATNAAIQAACPVTPATKCKKKKRKKKGKGSADAAKKKKKGGCKKKRKKKK
jgi:hypothetical protein